MNWDKKSKMSNKEFSNISNIDYQILFSLGYSDIVILFKTFSYQPIFRALNSVKESIHSIKSIYSIHGINKKFLCDWKDKNCKRASIFVSLKPGLSKTELKTQLLSVIKVRTERYSSLPIVWEI